MAIPVSEIVRMPAGTKEIYILNPGIERSYFLKKLSIYATRVGAKVTHRIATIIWDDDEMVSRMMHVTVIKAGKKKTRGKKK